VTSPILRIFVSPVFEDAPKGRVCARVFIGMSVLACVESVSDILCNSKKILGDMIFNIMQRRKGYPTHHKGYCTQRRK
jgi:hypothetical protein